jgi:predicted MFS family arabinose efflux permease
MSKLDKIKEQLGWLKIAFGIAAAVNISLVGWISQNFDTAPRENIGTAIAGVVIFTLAIIFINQSAIQRINQLEEL